MACDTASTLVFTLISPVLFYVLGVRVVIACCGLIWIITGLGGLFWNDTRLGEEPVPI